ncbi:MAG: hypothetical protein ACOX68_06620 [Candidatus Limivicinus sp.]|jgi:GalNAc-alpha-(1->4)-GalNAc-alpha-(1->3)-diNAcBac-PP-undecaprenol alpha-1,4-N-acetyl-D-galactosaminyltransferase
MRMPVISTDCPSGHSRKFICNGKNRLLVPVGDKKALASAMEELSKTESADRMGRAALNLRGALTDENVFRDWKNLLLKDN